MDIREGAAGARAGAVAVVVAAKAGDRQAMDDLVAEYLPLVYNIVGRALSGHADVDDVVQETMLRVVHGIDGLRDPSRFRSWLVAITVRQINDRWRARHAGPAPLSTLAGSATQLADPTADFVDLTILRLGLVGERREIAEATAWLEPADRRIASLWWLEATGQLTRAELTAALQLSAAHAAVGVQRMKTRLELAREIVHVLSATPRCPELDEALRGWDGRPAGLWRKRISRHLRHCTTCGAGRSRMTPPEALLAALPLVRVPATVAAHPFATTAVGTARAASTAALATHGFRWPARLLKLVLTKPAAITVTAVVATSGAVAVYDLYPRPHTHVQIITPTPADVITPTPPASASPAAAVTSTPSAAPTSQSATAAAYGSVVDQADAAPPADQKPGALPRRPADVPITATGKYETSDGTANLYLMNFNGDELKLTGQGYFRIRWQIIYWTGRVGAMAMPTWTGLTGELFHVASGGGRRMDDLENGSATGGKTGMGSTSTGYDTLPAGAQQMWQNEYYYLDGTVVLHQNQGWAWADLDVQPTTGQQITTDIDTPPDPADNIERYGLVRDTGTGSAPVPQYLTRSEPADAADVPQHSDVVD